VSIIIHPKTGRVAGFSPATENLAAILNGLSILDIPGIASSNLLGLHPKNAWLRAKKHSLAMRAATAEMIVGLRLRRGFAGQKWHRDSLPRHYSRRRLERQAICIQRRAMGMLGYDASRAFSRSELSARRERANPRRIKSTPHVIAVLALSPLATLAKG